jgi:ATP-dependent exoDNAse (exonuclease V) beta subunit
VIARELVGSDTPAGLIADFRDRIRAPRVRESLERTRYAAWRVDALEVLREQSFAVREGDAVITGTFDRVVIGSRGGIPVAAHVIDYKTDRVTTAEEVALRAHYYAPQITAYIGAAARFARLPVDAVGASILFVTPGIVHTYTPGSEAR